MPSQSESREMETDGRHDYLICKKLFVGFVVDGLDCLEEREWCRHVYARGVFVCVCVFFGGNCACVSGCGRSNVCVHVLM